METQIRYGNESTPTALLLVMALMHALMCGNVYAGEISYPGPYHIGDTHSPNCIPNDYSGRSIILNFIIDQPVASANLSFLAESVTNPAPVTVNGTLVGYIPQNTDAETCNYDSFFNSEIAAYLQIGNNNVTISCANLFRELDDIWVANIVIEYEEDTRQAFEIVSATFDQSVYQNGDTAHLTVVTRSNWGFDDNLSLDATLQSNRGDTFVMGQDFFGLSPGEEHTSTIDWVIPPESTPWEFSLDVNLFDGADPIDHEQLISAFTGSALSEAERQAILAEVEGCVTTWDDCHESAFGIIPVLGVIPAQDGYKHAACIFSEQVESGNVAGMAAAGFLMVLSGIDAFIAHWEVAGLINGSPIAWKLGLITSAPLAAGWCLDAFLNEIGGARGNPGLVSAIAAGALDVGSQHERPFSNQIFVSGARTIAYADSGRADTDSTDVFDSFFWSTESPNLQMVYLGPDPHLFAAEETNPHAAVELEFRPDSTGVMKLVILHRTIEETILWLEWPLLNLGPTSVVTLAMADSLNSEADFPLQIDYNGDGEIDFLWFPGEASDVPDAPSVDSSSFITGLQTQPNPTSGVTTISFQSAGTLQDVAVEVFDVSGREVSRIQLGDLTPGTHEASWGADEAGLPAGVYMYRVVHALGSTGSQRAVLLR